MKLRIVFFTFFVIFSTVLADDIKIFADKFEVDISSNYVNAVGDILILQGELKISADRAYYKDDKKMITLNDKIIAEYQGFVITCNKLVYYRSSSKISANDQVGFLYSEMSGRAESIDYFLAKEFVNLNGKTVINQKHNTINGRDMVIDLKKNKIYSQKQTVFLIGKE